MAFSQEKSSEKLQVGNYLVIGAYAKNKKELADKYAATISKKGYETSVHYFPKKKYHFVYIKYYEDFNASIRGLYHHRKIKDFSDCWIYVVRHSEIVDNARDKQVSSLSDMFASRFGTTEKKSSDSVVNNILINHQNEDDSLDNKIESERIVLETESKLFKPQTNGANSESKNDNSFPIFISLSDAQTATEIEGIVSIIDAVNNNKIGQLEGNNVVKLRDPENGTGNIIFISEVFGFKKQQLDFNFNEPLNDEEMPYVTNIGDTIVVNFELQRYKKGDFMIMYNVFFFKDAAIMKPESKYEINQLTTLMKERPKLKITIHGHTNGNSPGVIKHYNLAAKNYFSLSEVTKETNGSAKKLSEYRAEIIKQYLIDNGISKDRMDIKAWGGKSMIHEKHDTQAKRNVRVEIEFMTN